MTGTHRKGADFERAVAHWLSGWFAPARRVWRGVAGDDIAIAGPISFECKCQPTRVDLAGWVAQAKVNAGNRVPVVIAKRKGKTSVDDAYFILEGRAFRALVSLQRDQADWPEP
jgi:hypothetical protein